MLGLLGACPQNLEESTTCRDGRPRKSVGGSRGATSLISWRTTRVPGCRGYPPFSSEQRDCRRNALGLLGAAAAEIRAEDVARLVHSVRKDARAIRRIRLGRTGAVFFGLSGARARAIRRTGREIPEPDQGDARELTS
jgi:hypothetical protein